ncbi:sugar transferase [Mobilicoccus pelagius]|uniref:Putative glycosyltransferase n=1 Tax=Mobilicoccus pelagius NBRC 104925 TaxID=1089455 RepID=H5UMV0_9MICO|nr:sugar transferase [Mobilicoccus pelagius]GAB47058.1 putative glycosyltransferase [Mobilicoccus pelagius NBRC 104925]
MITTPRPVTTPPGTPLSDGGATDAARTGTATSVSGDHRPPRRRVDRRRAQLKRSVDVVVSAGGLLATSPLLAGIALAVRADSPGPVLFTQTRVGLHGCEFEIHKFRTMTVAAPGEDRQAVTATGDARITRVGALLRRTKLDELPQLYDVLVGHMSLVGPRPEVPRYVAAWDPVVRPIILSVRPGITDPASLAGIDEGAELARAEDPERHYLENLLPCKQAMYVAYVENATLAGDLRLVLDTVRALVTPRRR